MKTVIINRSDTTGGAAVVSRRLMEALRDCGVDARMIVAEKRSDSPYVEMAGSRRAIQRAFLAERLKIFAANGLRRSTLFKIDTASDGLPLWKHPLVKEADIICLGWINQGMLSFGGLEKLARTGKPIVWTMHDMWNMTGICHHAGSCPGFRNRCGDCRPLLGKLASASDISGSVWKKKQRLYSGGAFHFVAVSNWLKERAEASSPLSGQPLSVIPNPFPMPTDFRRIPADDGLFHILMGAARLDDPIKGLPLLAGATRVLAEKYPEKAARMRLVTFGDIKDPHALDGFGIQHRHIGRLTGQQEIAQAYSGADMVVSTSLYENLPGTLVEGQAFGCVPVSFLRGGQADIIDHGKTGILVDFDDSADIAAENFADGIIQGMELASDPQTAGRMLRSVTERFSAGSVARRYISLFNRLLS